MTCTCRRVSHRVVSPAPPPAAAQGAQGDLPLLRCQFRSVEVTATHLGIDETRRGKAKFRLVEAPDRGQIGEVVADRRHVGLVDLVGGAGLLGQVEGLTAASVSVWSGARTRQWRAGIQVVAIDMCTVFKAAVCDSLSAFSGGTGVRRGCRPGWRPRVSARAREVVPAIPVSVRATSFKTG